VTVYSTPEESCLAYRGHKSQSFCIASAGNALRGTCCDFDELRDNKARILSPWEYMAGMCSSRKYREKAPLIMFINAEVWWDSQAEYRFYASGCHLCMRPLSVGLPGKLHPVHLSLCSRTQKVCMKCSLLYFS